jgi:predicted HicB family RNase H-like nuclease
MADKTMSYLGYTGSVEASVEDECLHGQLMFINDLITYEGETIPDLVQAFHDAVDRYLSYCERTGKDANKPFSGTFNIRVGESRHRALAHKAAELGCNINDAVTQAVDTWLNPAPVSPTHNHVHLHVDGLQEMTTLASHPGENLTYRVMSNVKH